MHALPVPERLRPFVRSMRLYGPDDGTQEMFRRLPHAELELLVRFGAGDTRASVLGARTRTFQKPVHDPGHTLLVRFKSGRAYPFFEPPMSMLTDQMLQASELWDVTACDALAAASGAESVTRAAMLALNQALDSAAAREPACAPGMRRALRWLDRSPRVPGVAQLAAELGASERTLRRGFEQIVGTPPKQYLRVLRFRRALSAARCAPEPDWAALAEHVGYFDQAHMIAEFRQLTGTTPGALLPGRSSALRQLGRVR